MAATNAQPRRLGLIPTETRLTPPETSTKSLARPSLVARLRDSAADIVSVVAPAGYGKTTLLAQWAHHDPRPFAWLTINQGDNEPKTLLQDVADALDAADDAPHPSRRAGWGHATVPPTDMQSVLTRTHPFVLVLDDVHRVRHPACVELITTLIENLPPRSKVALAGRDDTALPLGRALASGRAFRVGLGDLAMTPIECVAVLKAAGVEHAADVGGTIAARVEGWAAGVGLAAAALRDAPDDVAAAEAFAGDDRDVTRYFEEEVLSSVSDSQAEFLLRSSVLDALSGPLCDAVLERTDSGGVLEGLGECGAFVVPLDRKGEWYRHHRLLGESLRSQLHRREPRQARKLLLRASTWFAEHGNIDAAIRDAHHAGDDAQAAALAWSGAMPNLTTGRSDRVGGWLGCFTAEEIGAHPALALTAAWWSITNGQMDELEHWLIAAEHDAGGVLPNGTPIRSATLLLRALQGRTVAEVRDRAALAAELDRPDSPYRCIARYLEGSALRLLGESTLARQCLEDALALSTITAPAVQVHCLAQLSALAIDENDWVGAADRSRSAIRVVDEHDLSQRPAMALHFAVAALTAARRPEPAEARAALEHAAVLLARPTGLPTWFTIQTQLLLVRTALLVGNVETARVLVSEAARHASRSPDAGVFSQDLKAAAEMIASSPIMDGVRETALTPAELRVLQYLPTQLTFGELGERLFVSRNTVKTQVHSIYRKLGVSSRTSAVERARRVGLLGR